MPRRHRGTSGLTLRCIFEDLAAGFWQRLVRICIEYSVTGIPPPQARLIGRSLGSQIVREIGLQLCLSGPAFVHPQDAGIDLAQVAMSLLDIVQAVVKAHLRPTGPPHVLTWW